MTILYLGTERGDAQAVATALRGVDRDVTLAHMVRLEDAARCLSDHRDVGAVVIDTQTAVGDWTPLLAQAHALPLRPAVIVIVPEETAFDALRPDVDDYIAKNRSWPGDLAGVVTRAVARAREHQRADLEQQLAQANAALFQAEAQHAAAMAAADAKLSEQQAQYEIAMARAAATWDMVDEQLRVAAREVERARQQQDEALADAERLTARDLELTTQLAGAVSARDAIERRLGDVEAAAQAARTQAERERIEADERAAARQRELESHVATETDRRRVVEAQLAGAIDAHTEAESRYTAALSDVSARARDLDEALRLVRLDLESKRADVDRLVARSTELDATLAEVTAARNELERKLSATQAAFEDATTRATRERLTASRRAADREAELDGQLRQERATRETLEQRIADAAIALRDARQQHDEALAAAARERAELEAQFTGELAARQATNDSLLQQLDDVRAALERSAQDHAAATATIESLSQRQTELTAELAGMQSARDALATQLSDVQGALDRTTQDHASAIAAIERLSERQNELTAELADGQAARHSLELQLADAETTNRRAAVRETELEGQLRRERATCASLEQKIAVGDAELRESHQRQHTLAIAHDELTHRLDDVQATLAEVEARAGRERAAASERQADLDARLAQEIATRIVVEQTLADARTAAADTERALREDVASLEARAVEQRAQFDVQIAQEQLEHEHRLADSQEVTRRVTTERDELHTSLATASTQAQQLQARLAATSRDLTTARADADRVPQLQRELEAARAENNRLFDQSGLPMLRCSRDGALLQANRASAVLLGRRTLDDVRGAQFAFAVFEAPAVLAWLIDQCVNARTRESLETTWRRKDGGRVFVRLSARSIAGDVIEIVAEDLTRVRVLQERLGQAHRMEAVGRFAAEVAVTGSTLLDAIYQKGREWLAVAATSTDSRREGERLLDEIARAAGLVRQLGACGDEQARTPMLVDLNTLMHDLEPVLEKVAGGNVDIQLRDTSSPLNVDLGTDQIERLLVNVAGYARERMPSGGQLRVELGTVVVNRRFVDRHPNVRLGLHALITVTEVRRTAAATGGRQSTSGTPAPRTAARPASRPGFDFGTIQGLVSDCGGHLWIKVQPQGEMVTKIRLPLVNPYAQAQPRPVVARGKGVASHFTKLVKQS
jgi:hypothetical protein